MAWGLGRLAGDEDLVIMNVVSGGCPDGARSAATYCPAARVACAELVPLLACGEKTKAPIPSMLFWSAAIFGSAAMNWSRVTPGSSRTRTGEPCASLVTLETIRTPPDCRVPPTVIFLPVIVIVITGRLPAALAATAEAARVGAARAALLVRLVRMIGPSANVPASSSPVRADRR